MKIRFLVLIFLFTMLQTNVWADDQTDQSQPGTNTQPIMGKNASGETIGAALDDNGQLTPVISGVTTPTNPAENSPNNTTPPATSQ